MSVQFDRSRNRWAKTSNNARAALSTVLAEATRQDLLARNPCVAVAPLPSDRVELDHVRLDEIDRYLDACTAHYRPLAELLTRHRGLLRDIRDRV